MTEDNIKCILPFKYERRTHGRCTTANDTNFWCAIAVDKSGTMLYNQYGYCNNDCKKEGKLSSVIYTYGKIR